MSLMIMMMPSVKTPFSVFDVEIVQPEKANKMLPEKKPKINRKVPLISKKPVLTKKIRRKQPEKNLEPNSMYGQEGAPTEKTPSQNTPEQEANVLEKKHTILSPAKKGIPIISGKSLFDKKTIEKFAKTTSPESTGLTFDTSEFKHRGYMRLLREKIQSTWQYPKEAAKLGISGDLYIKFTIKKNGELVKTEIIRTSGYRHLDKAAKKALKDAQPYWPLPEDWENEELEITAHFIYIYGNIYVM